MCIRDSTSPNARIVQSAALQCESLKLSDKGAIVLSFLPAEEFPSTQESVSYTHLRAHETVLDLVCRLLLEKKKNKHTNAYFHV